MKLRKKLKYVLCSIGLAGLAIIPTSVGLVSCSKKEEKDVIEHYKQVDNAIFNGEYMGKDSSPFICDFNLTQKTCAIVDWFGNEPNYMTPNLPPRTGLSEGLNQKINNTIRIPSQVVYNNEIFTVVAFGTISSWPLNNTYEGNLDLGDIMRDSIQIIEFDPNLKIEFNDDYYRGGNVIYYPGSIKQPNLLKVLNLQIYMDLSESKKLEIITGTFNKKLFFIKVNSTIIKRRYHCNWRF